MPVVRQQSIINIARDLKAFFKLELGVVRGAVPIDDPTQAPGADGDLVKKQRRRIQEQKREIAELRAASGPNGAGGVAGGLNPANIVWIFGDGRSGSTWLSAMMGAMKGQSAWGEPNVGALFGNHYYVWANDRQREMESFIMGSHRESWLNSIRNFVLAEAHTRFPDLKKNDYLVIKEPAGSVGAPLLMEALPESRIVFLVRDPRDVVASAMDAQKSGGWLYERTNAAKQGVEMLAGSDPDTWVRQRAQRYMLSVGNSKIAFEAHKGHKVLVRYEELRADGLGTMKRLYSTLGIDVNEQQLARVVKKRAWDNIPQEKKGQGRFHRKASPGSWSEDLTPEQAKVVGRITAPILEALYPE